MPIARFLPTHAWLLERGFKRRPFKDDYFLRLPESESVLYLSLMHEHMQADFVGVFQWDGYQYCYTQHGYVTGISESEYETQLQQCSNSVVKLSY